MSKKVFREFGKKTGPASAARRQAGLNLFPVLAFGSIVALSIYVIFRGTTFFNPGYTAVDRVFAVLLIIAELFMAVHAVGYLLSVNKAKRHYRVREEHFFINTVHPQVAVIVASFNEAPEILEETLLSVSSMDYADKTLYLLDDSTDRELRERIEALAASYGFNYVHREQRRGYKAGAINDLLPKIREKYFAVFDADQKPSADFLDQAVSLLESNDKLAFVQTPQFYQNIDTNAVAFGASYQQYVFYEYICEGKSVSNAMFSCGSNIVYRTEALHSIDGFFEESITEDFATGFRMHLKGWKSVYYNFVYVSGLGPESLAGYFTQQMRWALGILSLQRYLLKQFFRKPNALTPGQWWEYYLSGTYYWVGWVNLILMVSPMAFLLADVRPLIANPVFYIFAFLPYFLFATSTFYFSMWQRGYRIRYMLVGQSLSLNSFWVLMNAAVMAVFNIKKPFGVTPKGKSGKLNLIYLWPQLLLLAASLAAITVGILKVLAGYDFTMLINVVWVGYHGVLLGMIFRFNRLTAPYEPQKVFVEHDAPEG